MKCETDMKPDQENKARIVSILHLVKTFQNDENICILCFASVDFLTVGGIFIISFNNVC